MSIRPNDPAHFEPSLRTYTGQGAFRFWCQQVLPLTFDDSLSYYELLNKVVTYLNNTISDVANVEENVGALNEAYVNLQKYVNDYFSSLDVQVEIDNKLDEMASDGTLSNLINPFIPNLVSQWLNDNVDPVGSAVIVDSSLTISGAAADAKATGDKIADEKDYSEWKYGMAEEETANLCIVRTGRYKRANAGNIVVSGNSYMGLENYIPCEPETTYYFYCYGTGWVDSESPNTGNFIYWLDENMALLDTESYSKAGINIKNAIVSPASAAFMYYQVYRAAGIPETAKLQITKGEEPLSAYISPFTGKDDVARSQIEEVATVIETLEKNTALQNYGLVTNNWLTEQGYTNLIQLPVGFTYAISSSIVIDGKPEALQNSVFTFMAIKCVPSQINYNVYFAIGRNSAYYAIGFVGDMTINWKNFDDVSSLEEIATAVETLEANTALQNYGLVTSNWLTEQGYTNLIQLPVGFTYAISSSIVIDGKPEALQNSVFTFMAIKCMPSQINYNVYFAIGRHSAYYAIGFVGDTTINWKDFNGVDPDYTLFMRHDQTDLEVVLLGDSITQGVGSSDYSATGEEIITIPSADSQSMITYRRNVGVKSWAAKFKEKLEQDYRVGNNATIHVINNGLPGRGINVTAENLDDLVYETTNVAIVCGGPNTRNSQPAIQKGYYVALFEALKAKNIYVLALSAIPTNGATYSGQLHAMGPINAQIELACQQCNVPYYDLYSEFCGVADADPETMASYFTDGLHPNDKGYNLMYALICKLLRF